MLKKWGLFSKCPKAVKTANLSPNFIKIFEIKSQNLSKSAISTQEVEIDTFSDLKCTLAFKSLKHCSLLPALVIAVMAWDISLNFADYEI